MLSRGLQDLGDLSNVFLNVNEVITVVSSSVSMRSSELNLYLQGQFTWKCSGVMFLRSG